MNRLARLIGVLLIISVICLLAAFVIRLVSVAVIYTYGILAHIMIIMTVFNAVIVTFYLVRFARWLRSKHNDDEEE